MIERFLKKEGVGASVPNQCEVTHVNHIVAGAGNGHCPRRV